MNQILTNCPVCTSEMAITRLECATCNTAIEGQFNLGRLSRLTRSSPKSSTIRTQQPWPVPVWRGRRQLPGGLEHPSCWPLSLRSALRDRVPRSLYLSRYPGQPPYLPFVKTITA